MQLGRHPLSAVFDRYLTRLENAKKGEALLILLDLTFRCIMYLAPYCGRGLMREVTVLARHRIALRELRFG